MYFGADYYPEHWPKERWPKDIQLMKEAGFNVVRLAEFTWCRLEPKDGVFDFSWLDEILDLFYQNQINVVLCTPTATPPKWLMDKHPDIYPVDDAGNVRTFGSRRHYCFNNPHFKKHTQQIVSAMAEHYLDHPAVMGWQLDNEFGCHDTVRCYCEYCEKAFQNWLKKQYKEIQAFNEKNGLIFWSQEYSSFEQVILPKSTTVCHNPQLGMNAHNPGLFLDYCRFASDSVCDYANFQIKLLKDEGIKTPITHNYMAGFYDIDYHRLSKNLDFVSWDCYPNLTHQTFSSDFEMSYQHDKIRGYQNQNFWVMEMASGPLGWNTLSRTPKPGQLRMWTYQAIAHGAQGIVYFRWRPCLFGTEQYWHGVLDHDGLPRQRYQEIQKVGNELKQIQSISDGFYPNAKACMLYSFDNEWSHGYQSHSPSFNYNQILSDIHQALQQNQINCDVCDLSADLSSYDLVIVPAYNLITSKQMEPIKKYVANGGNLVVTFRSGNRDLHNKINGKTLPGEFHQLTGIDVISYDALDQETISIKGLTEQAKGSMWCDVLDAKKTTPLAWYDECFYQHQPCVTLNKYQKGQVVYIGTHLDIPAYANLFSRLVDPKNAIVGDHPSTVEIVYQKNQTCFIINHSDQPQTCTLKQPCLDLLTQQTEKNHLRLNPFDVKILEI